LKPGAAAQLVFYLPPDRSNPADESFLAIGVNGHKVDYLSNPFGRKEPREQNIRIRQIQLFSFHLLKLWADTVAPSFFVVQQGGEYTGGIKSWEAHEVNGTVEANQGNRV
jgi:hypothetical protein